MSWKPDTQKKQGDHHALYQQYRSSHRAHSANGYTIFQARPRQGSCLEVAETMPKLLELLDGQRNSIGQKKTPLAEKKLGVTCCKGEEEGRRPLR